MRFACRTKKHVLVGMVCARDKKGMESWKNRSPVRHELGTAETALGRVGRAGVGEHDEGVACRRVDVIASYREKGKNLRLRKAVELSPSSSCNFVHVFTRGASPRRADARLRLRAIPVTAKNRGRNTKK